MSLSVRVLCITALAVAGQACSFEQAYQPDSRVEIVSPRAGERVPLPVRLRWDVEGFEISGARWSDPTFEVPGPAAADPDAGYFAVFVDRPPIPVGVELMSLAAGNVDCERAPGCPDGRWFADRGIYITNRTELVLETLADRRPNNDANDWHQVTIVLVNDTGGEVGEIGEVKRIGTGATRFSVRFMVERTGPKP